jgi:hypothetical protein
MTFSFRPRSNVSVASFAFASFAIIGVLLVGLVASGCEDKHIGRVCSLDAPDAGASGTGTSAILNGSAVECPSRICLLPAGDKVPMTGPLCTAGCSSDDDCDGETSSRNKLQCHSGFTCMVATTVGDFCCERLCVCKDFIDTTPRTPAYNATPASCVSGKSSCKNVH